MFKHNCSFEDNIMSHKTAIGSKCGAFSACTEVLDLMPRVKGGGKEEKLPEAEHKASTTKDSCRDRPRALGSLRVWDVPGVRRLRVKTKTANWGIL